MRELTKKEIEQVSGGMIASSGKTASRSAGQGIQVQGTSGPDIFGTGIYVVSYR